MDEELHNQLERLRTCLYEDLHRQLCAGRLAPEEFTQILEVEAWFVLHRANLDPSVAILFERLLRSVVSNLNSLANFSRLTSISQEGVRLGDSEFQRRVEELWRDFDENSVTLLTAQEKQMTVQRRNAKWSTVVGLGLALVVFLIVYLASLSRISEYSTGATIYVVYVVIGLFASAVLFLAMRSFASASGRKFGFAWEFGGPAATFAFVLLVGLGFETFSNSKHSFNTTAIIKQLGEHGQSPRSVNENGTISFSFDPRKRYPITDGIADLPSLHPSLRGTNQTIHELDLPGYELADLSVEYNLDQGSTIYILVNPQVRFTTELVIQNSDTLVTPDKSHYFELSTYDDEQYVLAAHFQVSFRNPRFNNDDWLRCLSNVSVPTRGQRSDYSLAGFTVDEAVEREYLSGWAYVKFMNAPRERDVVQLQFGPVVCEAFVGNLNWNTYPRQYGSVEKSSFTGAVGELKVGLDDPSWPFLRGARLNPTSEGNGSLLEILIENHSSAPFLLDSISIRATNKRLSLNQCFDGDPITELTLSWEVLMVSDGKEGAKSTLKGVPVDVNAEYSDAGECSDYSFECVVPLNNAIRPMESGKILIRLWELPPPTGSFFPGSIINWEGIEVSVSPAEIFPSQVRVSRLG